MEKPWGDVVIELARMVHRGSVAEVRRAVLLELERRIPFAGASFHTFGADACSDPATTTVGTGRMLLERVTSVWAQQLAELEGSPLASMAELGVARLSDVRWQSGTARETRTWKEVFEAVGVGDTLNVFIRVPAGPPRLLVLIRNGDERFTEEERDWLRYLLPFLTVAERSESAAEAMPVTPAQKKILLLLRKGLTNDEISEQLGLSANTVRNQLSDVYERCGVANRTELVALTMKYGDEA